MSFTSIGQPVSSLMALSQALRKRSLFSAICSGVPGKVWTMTAGFPMSFFLGMDVTSPKWVCDTGCTTCKALKLYKVKREHE